MFAPILEKVPIVIEKGGLVPATATCTQMMSPTKFNQYE